MKDKDILIIKREAPPASGWKPITISVEVWEDVKKISEDTGLPMSKVAVELLSFGLERVVIED